MRIFLAFVLLLNSYIAVGGTGIDGLIAPVPNDCKAYAKTLSGGRGPAAAPQCQTPEQLMSVNLNNRDFTRICKTIRDQDAGCKKLKPEKRMSCNAKRENQILSSADLLQKAGQCAKGFLWDSMVDLGKFIWDIIKMLAGAQVKTVTGMIKFLTDSDYREKTLAAAGNAANAGSRLGKAFLNSAGLYFAREFPRNLAKHPFNPLAAIGATLFNPLMKFMTEAVQQIAAHYIPQYQCMNGTAKLYTICRVLGDFIMPPLIMFTFLKSGIRGLQALRRGSQAVRISRVERRFAEANELRQVAQQARRVPAPSRITVDNARVPRVRRTPAPAPVRTPRPAPHIVHPRRPAPPQPLVKPIEEHSADELIEFARSERIDPEVAATASANQAELSRLQALDNARAPEIIVESADDVAERLADVNEYKTVLQGLAGSEKAEAAHAIEQLSKSGASPAIVVGMFRKYSPQFRAEIARVPAGSEDLWSKLGRFIKKEKDAGKTDQAISHRIDEAFNCK